MARTQKGLLIPLTPVDRKKANDYIIEIIIKIIHGKKNYGDNPVKFGYILGQTIREYLIPKRNWHLSDGAYNLWRSITTEDIQQYDSKQVIHCSLANGQQIAKFYKGASGGGEIKKIVKDERIVFNNVFIVEHVIPIKEIVEQIIHLKNPKKTDIKRILNTMHLCRMLKEEDRNIANKYNRGKDFNAIIRNDYNPVGITLKY